MSVFFSKLLTTAFSFPPINLLQFLPLEEMGGRARRVLIDWLRCKQRGLEQFGKHTLVTV